MIGKGNGKEMRDGKGNEMATGRGCWLEFVEDRNSLLESFYMEI
jgi:hypothetical protein